MKTSLKIHVKILFLVRLGSKVTYLIQEMDSYSGASRLNFWNKTYILIHVFFSDESLLELRGYFIVGKARYGVEDVIFFKSAWRPSNFRLLCAVSHLWVTGPPFSENTAGVNVQHDLIQRLSGLLEMMDLIFGVSKSLIR